MISFCTSLNFGCELPPTRPRIALSLVVRKAPDCFIRSRANIRFTFVRLEQASTTMCTSKPFSSRSSAVPWTHTWVSAGGRRKMKLVRSLGLLVIDQKRWKIRILDSNCFGHSQSWLERYEPMPHTMTFLMLFCCSCLLMSGRHMENCVFSIGLSWFFSSSNSATVWPRPRQRSRRLAIVFDFRNELGWVHFLEHRLWSSQLTLRPSAT